MIRLIEVASENVTFILRTIMYKTVKTASETFIEKIRLYKKKKKQRSSVFLIISFN